MPSFSGRWPRRQASAFFATHGDFVLTQERANVFESDRCLVNLHAVVFGDGIEQVRGGYAARGAEFVAAGFEQVIEEQTRDMVGLDEPAVVVQDAEAGRRRRQSPGLLAIYFLGPPILEEPGFLGRVGAGAVEQHVALGADGCGSDSVVGQDAVHPAGAGAVGRVVDEVAFAFCRTSKRTILLELVEIGLAGIDESKSFSISPRAAGGSLSAAAPFDILGDFGQRSAPFGA